MDQLLEKLARKGKKVRILQEGDESPMKRSNIDDDSDDKGGISVKKVSNKRTIFRDTSE